MAFAVCVIFSRMTTTELELKTRRFAAKMSDKQVASLHEIIEDILDARAVERSLAGKGGKTVSWKVVEADLVKRLGLKFE